MARDENSDDRSDHDNDGDVDLLDLASEHPQLDTDGSLAPPVVSNRTIGVSRSQSRSRHRHHRRRNRLRFKRKESNFVAAVCSMIVLVLLCTALAEPQWFYLNGGGCRDIHGNPVNYIGVNHFFYDGKLISKGSAHTTYQYGPNRNTDVLVNCVTVQVVSIMKSIISLTFFGIVLSLIAFLLDLSGPTHRLLKILRRHGILSILTVGFCVVINGFSYWATEDLSAFQRATKLKTGSKVDIRFSISFFLITAAGATSVIAAACNLLRRHTGSSLRDSDCEATDQEQLLGNFDDLSPESLSQSMPCLPPPPPYSP